MLKCLLYLSAAIYKIHFIVNYIILTLHYRIYIKLTIAQKVSLFGVILVRIFLHSDLIRRDKAKLTIIAEICSLKSQDPFLQFFFFSSQTLETIFWESIRWFISLDKALIFWAAFLHNILMWLLKVSLLSMEIPRIFSSWLLLKMKLLKIKVLISVSLPRHINDIYLRLES